MNTRLQQFLSAEGLTQAQFADSIGVARAGISHILAGRNNPGYDFFLNVARVYPDLNLDWLLLGKGRMYKGQAKEETNLFTQISPQAEAPAAAQDEPKANSSLPIEMDASNNLTHTIEKQRNVSRIIVFYDDDTFKEFR